MVLALLVLLMCDNACDTSGWQRGASGLVFVFFSVRMTGYVVVNVYFSCCLWVEGSMSHHVSEGEWFSSGCGVRGSCHSTLGDCPLLVSWNGASPPPSVLPAALHSGVLPMPFSVPWGQGHSNSSLSC